MDTNMVCYYNMHIIVSFAAHLLFPKFSVCGNFHCRIANVTCCYEHTVFPKIVKLETRLSVYYYISYCIFHAHVYNDLPKNVNSMGLLIFFLLYHSNRHVVTCYRSHCKVI